MIDLTLFPSPYQGEGARERFKPSVQESIMKKYIQSLLILILIIPGKSYSQYPVVQSIINQVNIDSLLFFVEELTGEVQTIIGGTPYTRLFLLLLLPAI